MTTSQPEIEFPEPNSLENVQQVYDSLAAVSEILDCSNSHSVFLVADPVAYELSGAKTKLEKTLASRRVEVFSEFRPNPTLEYMMQGIECYRKAKPDIILAVGGGTAIDLAKLIGFCDAQPVAPADYIKSPSNNPRKGPPLIATPTTAGTGSEATHFAVVYLDGQKYSVAHSHLIPEYAIVDPSLTNSMPPHVTAETGLDAFAQAVESMWSVLSTVESLGDAVESIRLTWQHLHAAVHHPTEEDRQAMCRAAHLAGKAINISKTTAPHAISYTITSQHSMSHGRAVALTLGTVLSFNHGVSDSDCSDPRGADYVRKTVDEIVHLLGFETTHDAAEGIRKFVASLDCPTRLSEVGIETDSQLEKIVERVNTERLANNPRQMTSQSLREILQSIR